VLPSEAVFEDPQTELKKALVLEVPLVEELLVQQLGGEPAGGPTLGALPGGRWRS
jgi:hypothetical protein